MSAYEDHISVLTFAGLNQSAETNLDLKYAVDGFGFDVENGVMKSAQNERAYELNHINSIEVPSNFVIPNIFNQHNKTDMHMLGVLYERKERAGEGEFVYNSGESKYLVAVIRNCIYYKRIVTYANGSVHHGAWTTLEEYTSSEGLPIATTYDCVRYEINRIPLKSWYQMTTEEQDDINSVISSGLYGNPYEYYDSEQSKYVPIVFENGSPTHNGMIYKTVDYPVDALFIAGMYWGLQCVYVDPDRDGVLSLAFIETPERFSCICVSNERLWGSGISTAQDKLMYSAPHDPFCWEQNNDSPADGAGDILQPNFDGDSFIALRSFGGQILAFKKRRIWRVLGSSPEDFTFREQYGGGAILEDSIAIHGTSAYFISEHGLTVYDGNSAGVIANGKYRGFLYENALPRSYRAVFCGDTYYLSYVDVQDKENEQNMLIKYNIRNGTVTAHKLVCPILAMCEDGKDILCLMLDRFSSGHDVCILDNPRRAERSGRQAFKWISAYQDMGQSNVVKSGFLVYMTVDAPVEMTIGIRTEKKLKQKTVTFTPNKPKRIQINNSGRRFRLEMSADAGGVPFKILGGVQIHLEYDVD